jgi:hypothetical protein
MIMEKSGSRTRVGLALYYTGPGCYCQVVTIQLRDLVLWFESVCRGNFVYKIGFFSSEIALPILQILL